jgi:hypothetical protein
MTKKSVPVKNVRFADGALRLSSEEIKLRKKLIKELNQA